MKAKKADEHYDTVIGKGAELDGTFDIKHGLRIEGTLRGQRLSTKGMMIVGGEGEVTAASIEVGKAVIGGKVSGALKARQQVYMEDGAWFRGHLETPRLVIEEGAVLQEDAVLEEEGAGAAAEAAAGGEDDRA